ncbi:MAG: ATP-binding cassette domain-containing protein [Phycisphaerales bacterium]|nr:ATP-binding cassette domain-containing protein [Phycisphaerales bacterium]
MNRETEKPTDLGGGRLTDLLRPHARRLALVVVLLSLLVATNLALPYAVKLLIDDVFPHEDGTGGNWTLLWAILPLLGLIYVIRNALFYPSRMLSVRVSEDVCFSMRKRLFEYLQQLSLRFYKAQQPGKVGSRLLDDTFKIQFFIQDKLPTLLLNVLMAQVLLIILYAVNWRLALASSIVLPLHFGTYWFFKRPIKRRHTEAQENIAAAYGNVIEKYLGVEVVKGFTGEGREKAQFHRAIDASRHSQIGTQRYEFMQKVVGDLFVGVGTVFLFGFGAWQVMKGHMTGGTFIMFFGYVGMLYPAMQEVISGTSHLSKTTACVDRVFEMLHQPDAESDSVPAASGQVAAAPLLGAIEFRNVSFAFGHGRTILKNISLTIRPGERVAITGPSGSGKSTLLNLLPRFIDPTSGQVLVDGHDVRSVPINKLRSAIGIAFQEVFLFDASISENLRYARPDATEEELADVCRLTGADRFIEKRPDGYDSRIGPNGSDLSRGERQRINLARALLKQPLLLVLDEATASIDNRSSVTIIQSILSRFRTRTVVMITHKPELLELADRVVVIRDGRVAFDGPPGESALLDLRETPLRGAGDTPLRSPVPDRLITTVRDGAKTDMPTEEKEEASPVSSEKPVQQRATVESKPHLQVPRTTITSILIVGWALLGLLNPGCVSESTSTRTYGIESARASGGLLVADPAEADALRLRDAIESSESEQGPLRLVDPGGRLSPTREDIAFAQSIAGGEPERVSLAERQVEAALAQPESAAPALPPDAGKLITVPRLSSTELGEMIRSLALAFETEQGYSEVTADSIEGLPPLPEEINYLTVLGRHAADGTQSVLALGYRTSLSQPPQVWAVGLQRTAAEAPWAVNPDLAQVQTRTEALVAGLDAMRTNLTPENLSRNVIQLSYIDATGALTALQGLGVNVVANAAQVPQQIEYAKLPLVVQLPSPTPEQTGLVGSSGTVQGNFGVTVLPNTAAPLSPDLVSSPSSRLLVLYHPANPQQLARVRNLLTDYIDRPARQIFVEGMVLEISQDGLDDLGIEWQFREGPIDLVLGKLVAGGLEDTLDFSRVDSRDVPRDWSARIRALVREGKAEILSRPSVLTIDNRQATIRVGEDIPIATSQEGTATGSNKLSFSFQYIPTGILLNVRPRITERADEISMLIDTVVSAVVPGRDLEIRSTDGDLLATAPTISTRRVQTYARIDNNTPFIIGGLVSRDLTITKDKVPLLGDLPLVGLLFQAQRTQRLKREVIIVLTPYVLPEDIYVAGPMPKDEDLFDSFGNKLFRDSYRLRAEDVFDLRFLPENRRMVTYSSLAARAVRQDARLANVEPFSEFIHGRIPGEDILVHRMIYELIKRLDVRGTEHDLSKQIQIERLIYLESEQFGGYSVQFLENAMSRLGKGTDYASFFKQNPDKALVLTYHYDRESDDPLHLGTEPIPELAVYDCPDRKAWGKLLWELNQALPDGRKRFSVVLNDESDLVRLRRAIMLKKVIAANGGQSQSTLANFSVGKVLMMPETKEGQTNILDADVARLFFHTEHYYSAAINEIEERIAELDAALRSPEIRPLLDGAELP